MQTGKLISKKYSIVPCTANSGSNPVILKTSHCEITASTAIANIVFADGNPHTGAVIWLYGNEYATLTTAGNIVVDTNFLFDSLNKEICLFFDGTVWREIYRTNLNGAQGSTGDSPSGSQGSQGAPGSQGDNGGDSGVQGAQGATGDVGPQGAQGAPGDQGTQGAQGAQGAPGAGGDPPP